MVAYSLTLDGVVAGEPATGVVSHLTAARVRPWLGCVLPIVPPGNTAIPSAAPPLSARVRMPESTFDTLQMQAYLEGLRAGDRQAADALLRATCARLEHLARKMLKKFPNVKRWADTDDVLQNALLRLLRTLEVMRPASTRDFVNLAAVHIRRELLDLARHYRQYLDVPVDFKSGADPIADAPAPTDCEDLDRWSAFHEAVEQLPAAECEVMTLVFYHGWTQPQMAEFFMVDERTVRRRWRRARALLSEKLGNRFPEA